MIVALLAAAVGGVSAQEGDRGGRSRDRLEERRGQIDRPVRAALRLVMEQIGLEPAEMLELLRDGQTVAQIITGSGGSVADVTAMLTEATTERINTALENGHITQERADEMLANLASNIERLLNTTLQEGRVNAAERRLAPAVAEAAGITLQDLRTGLLAGETLGGILSANGVDPAAFVIEQTAKAGERLAQAVENGRITQERADEMLSRYTERITAVLNGQLPERPVTGNA
jgi:hypothetical protein